MELKQYTIGTGKPLICVPVTEREKNEIIKAAEQAVVQGADALEWRMDWFGQNGQWDKVREVLEQLAGICGDVILLCTFRSKSQGGRQEITEGDYIQLLRNVAVSGLSDLLDVEVAELTQASQVIEQLHKAGQRVIGSQHYFFHTPELAQMQQQLISMRTAGADIGKLAVMPKTPLDVIRLLEATAQVKEAAPEYPLVTMAMEGLGAVSRISGQVFGSCMTFASSGKASAPGQLLLEDTAWILNKISESMEKRDEM